LRHAFVIGIDNAGTVSGGAAGPNEDGLMLLSVEQWRGILLASEPDEAAQRILTKMVGYNMPRGTITRENDVKQLANALRAWRER
jgi:hypothetical protein